MKKTKHSKPCEHDWNDLYQFKTTNGARFIQQKCSRCNETRYLEVSMETNQNGSNNEVKCNEA